VPVNIKQNKILLRLFLILVAMQSVGSFAYADELKPFEATYAWKWHGMTIAVSTLTLKRQDGETWAYSSKSVPQGLASAIRPERPTQLSIVRVNGEVVQPLSYKADDGTKATYRDSDVKFDWDRLQATGVYDDAPVDLQLKAGLQDDLSVQIAMMVQLLKGKTPENLSIINKNSVRDYQYIREGEVTLQTPMGAIPTVIYRSERTGSKRVTRFWCSPSGGYMPMRVEQKNKDSVEWTMDILSLSRQ
jgi:hypothetical protein